MNVNFIGYVGGKFYLKEKIYSILPNHTIFVEVFGGAANVLLHKSPSKVEVYNDLRLLQLVKNIKGKFILTTYENELYSKELKGFNLITFDAVKHSCGVTRLSKSKGKPKVKKLVYFNFELQQNSSKNKT